LLDTQIGVGLGRIRFVGGGEIEDGWNQKIDEVDEKRPLTLLFFPSCPWMLGSPMLIMYVACIACFDMTRCL
jgi:hypothetical protein